MWGSRIVPPDQPKTPGETPVKCDHLEAGVLTDFVHNGSIGLFPPWLSRAKIDTRCDVFYVYRCRSRPVARIAGEGGTDSGHGVRDNLTMNGGRCRAGLGTGSGGPEAGSAGQSSGTMS